MKTNFSDFSVNLNQQQPQISCPSLYANNIDAIEIDYDPKIDSDYNINTNVALENSCGFEAGKPDDKYEKANDNERFDENDKLKSLENIKNDSCSDHVHFKAIDDATTDKEIASTASCEERETWSKKLDFLMSIIGFSVDIAGIWRLLVFLFKMKRSLTKNYKISVPICVLKMEEVFFIR